MPQFHTRKHVTSRWEGLAAVFILDSKRTYGRHMITEEKWTKLVLDCRLPQEHFVVQFA
jgi:hypothetical protein